MPTTATPQRVLVTGSQGFTGRYVAQRLQQAGYRVIGTSTHPRGAATGVGECECLPLDLQSAEQTAQVVKQANPHAVIHLAALAFVGHGDQNAFYDVNVKGTRNLLSALAQSNAPLNKVILASSANVYGNSTEGQLDETSPFNPANDYAVSKVAMEHIASLWAEKLPLLITRPFNYTGVGQETRYLVAKIVHHFRTRAAVIELGNTDIARDFSDVRDIASAYQGLLDSSAQGQAVNLCSGQQTSLQEVIDLCAELTGHRMDVQVNPAFVREKDVKKLFGDNRRLQQHLPSWKPQPLSTTLQWMLEAR
ncbi:MAG: GDP-mannose 4,6-dehydratase [Halomonas sp.]|jgi:GDP-6-deoxy-D-talose 4-dehydrogenase|nr:GDP-mannose 4,6-dehydratase [Halomonas sp.]MBL1266196.1 GDP-mannose 4,6-dehydratase [Halomonas sp.]